MSALTGVGPSIASGSHTCSGNCADLPTAPANIPRATHVATPLPIATICAPASSPPCASRLMCPISNGLSPWLRNASRLKNR